MLAVAKGHEDLLVDVIRTKSFVGPKEAAARSGVIDSRERFSDLGAVVPAPGMPPVGVASVNAALFYGPATPAKLAPFVVFVPDTMLSSGWIDRLRTEAGAGRFVFLVPDEKGDNRWNPTQRERRRHVGPLRDFLLEYPIDPDRLYLVGTGRGGHATWDVGLVYAGCWAGIFPCNGSLIHEGGYKKSGGVFLENAKSLVVRTVYNTSFDHGIEGCRYAAQKFKEWGYRFEAVEEPTFRDMEIPEAMTKLGGVVRDAHPRELVKRFNHLDAGDHYWLRALSRKPGEWSPTARMPIMGKWPDDPLKQREAIWESVKSYCAFMKASARDQTIEVTTQGIGTIRVYFDPAIVNDRAKVTVSINGVSRTPFVPERKTETMLQHVHETGDTARLYWSYRDFGIN